MTVKTSILLFMALLFSHGVHSRHGSLNAIPPQYNHRAYENDNGVAIKEMRNLVENLRHAFNNHETEIRAFDEKFTNFDSIMESLRDQVGESTQSQKEQVKGSVQNLESKIAILESNAKSVVSDLKQLKNHANESAMALTQIVQKFNDLEKVIERQNQDIDHLQAALHSIVEAFGGDKEKSGKSGATPSTEQYRVKPGDTLEKIAHVHQTTVRALKELNHMPEGKDKIVVGKILLIPEKKK